MRSAIYYPRTEVHSEPLMRSSLLLWDRLHTIVPDPGYRPDYGNRREMARAWELIGEKLVPDRSQQQLAHHGIEELLVKGIPPALQYTSGLDRPDDAYEIWPQKFAAETWALLRQHRLTGGPLDNGDYPFTEEGGLLVMAKLADACAGSTFARVTDRLLAYGLIADGNAVPSPETEVVPITLDLIDAASIPLQTLIDFREREKNEQRGGDYSAMRHRYADAVQRHVDAIKNAATPLERNELNRQFGDDMARDLLQLSDALRVSKAQLILKPVVVATVVGAGSVLAAGLAGPAALIAAGSAALGTSLVDAAKHIADLFSSGLSFSRKQKETMAMHPMAYMYALSRV
jgi:hypothetical protein